MRSLRLLQGGLVFLLFTGCAGYQLGPTNGVKAGEKSIRINPFSNQTLEPRLGDAVTTALRRNVQNDGTYHLSTHGDADIVVTGVLTRFNRHELSFVPKDVLTVKDYRIFVTAQVTAREASGKLIFEKKDVTGYTLVRVGSDLSSAERQAVPLLADDLAKNVTAMLVDGSW
jgi:hypothetical protein